MKIEVRMQKSNDDGTLVIGRGKPAKALSHALHLLQVNGNDPHKILNEMKKQVKK